MKRPILRLPSNRGTDLAVWVAQSGELRGWSCDNRIETPEETQARDGGWTFDCSDASACNLTLGEVYARLERLDKETLTERRFAVMLKEKLGALNPSDLAELTNRLVNAALYKNLGAHPITVAQNRIAILQHYLGGTE